MAPSNSKVRFLCGPPGSGKTERIYQEYETAVRASGSDSVILLLPEETAVATARAQLAQRLGGLYDARIMTFDDLARALLRSHHALLTPLAPCQRLLLARRLAAEEEIGFPAEALTHTGFIPALLNFVDELKRAAVEPRTFSDAINKLFPDDAVAAALARFYTRYQNVLAERQLYDEAGLFWQATALLKEGHEAPFQQARLVLVDGFTDFTTTQLHVLRHLAEGRRLCITLTLSPQEVQQEAYAAAWRLLRRMEEQFPRATIEYLSARDDRPPALRRLVDCLFAADPGQPVDAQGVIYVLAAPGMFAEVQEIMRAVKSLLATGVAADEICLIFRSLGPYRRLLEQTAREFGIPLAIAEPEPLALRPSVQVVLDLLQIILDDFALADVVQFLKSNFVDLSLLQPARGAIPPETFEAIACAAQIIGGKEEWRERLRQYGARLTEELALSQRGESAGEESEEEEGSGGRPPHEIEREREDIERAAALFNELAKRLQVLAQPGTRMAHIERLTQLIEDFGLPQRLAMGTNDSPAAPAETNANIRAFTALMQLLRQIADADRFWDPAAQISCAEFARELQRLCAETKYSPAPLREGHVVALDAYRARQWRKPYVFIGGLEEGRWPSVLPEEPFFDDERRRALADHGVPLALAAERQEEERYLFLLACATATQQLTLCYPTADSNGDPLLRSHYLEELLPLFTEDSVPKRERSLSQIVPPLNEITCLRELLEYATRHPDTPIQAALGALVPEAEKAAAHAFAMAAIEKQRYAFEFFDVYDGILASAAVQEQLAKRFGPNYGWSASALSLYGRCPFRYFVERVLKLEAIKAPQEEPERLDLGLIAHRVLREFFRRHQAQYPSQLLRVRDLDAICQEIAELAATIFAERERQGLVTHQKLWELARDELIADLQALLRFEHNGGLKHNFVPWAFEARFDVHVPDGEAAERLRLVGKIDRVDAEPHAPQTGGRRYFLYDYKPGVHTVDRNQIDKGLDFQLPFYACGAPVAAFPGEENPVCAGWAYYCYRRPITLAASVGEEAAGSRKSAADYVAAALKNAVEYVRAIRAGLFPVAPRDCSAQCEVRPICRHFAWRAAAKGAFEIEGGED